MSGIWKGRDEGSDGEVSSGDLGENETNINCKTKEMRSIALTYRAGSPIWAWQRVYLLGLGEIA